MGETQRKGDRALSRAIASFSELGFGILIPLSESLPYDLVVDIGKELKRVQVKFTSGNTVRLTRIHSNSKGYVIKWYAPDSYDWLYILKADGSEYLIKECMTFSSVLPFEEERLENWQEPSPRGKLPTHGGERHPRTKFTSENVLEIRQLYTDGVRIGELARRFGVNHSTIQSIVHRKTWTHL